jgi:hypothetical protein
MNTSVIHHRVSPGTLASGVLVCAAVWCAAAWAWRADNAWASAPLFWMALLVVGPVLTGAGGAALVQARRPSRFTPLDWCALAAALVTFLLGGWRALHAMSAIRGLVM